MISTKNSILLIAFIVIAAKGNGQNIDSLKQVLGNASGQKEKATLTFSIGQVFLQKRNFDSSALFFSKAMQLAKDASFDSLVMETHDRLAHVAQGQRKADEAIKNYEQAIALAADLHYPDRGLNSTYGEATAFAESGRFDSCMKKSQRALQTTILTNNKKREEQFCSILARCYLNKRQFGLELDMLIRAAHINDSLGNPKGLAFDYSKIAVVYSLQHKPKEALRYSQTADSIYRKIGDERSVYYNMEDMKQYYYYLENYDKAIEISKTLLKYFADDSSQYLDIYSGFGNAYLGKKNYSEALKYYELSKYYNNFLGASEIADFQLNNAIAKILLETGHPDSAMYYATLIPWDNDVTKADKSRLGEYAERLSIIQKVYVEKGDKKNAQLFFDKYEACRDSLDDRHDADYRDEAEARFDIDEKNRELKTLATENELQKIKVQNNRITELFLISFLALGAIIVGVIIAYNRRVVKQNAVLADQKKTLSEQKDKIDAQNTQLANDMKMKEKFMANVSHELRTPVTLISGILELMKDEIAENKEQNQARLNVAYNNSRKLQKMIEEILDLTRVENRIVKNNPKIVDITPLLSRVTYTFDSFVRKGNQLLVYENNLPTGTFVKLDEDIFEKIMNNIIYNAFKFNKEGECIKVVSSLSAAKNKIVISVTDSGKGIKPEDLPHIFERFYQGSGSGNESGIGIGLSLVKEFTDMAGGSVEVSSKPGMGATFTLYFPVVDHVADKEKTIENDMVETPEDWGFFAQKQTVLVIEDNEDMRYYLNQVFGSSVNIIEAGNGAEALKWLENNTPDLLITDLMMPEMDGKELVTHLKADDRYNKIPVIMLTAIAGMDSQLNMLRMGIDDYIVKPFNKEELKVRAYNLLKNNAERKAFNEEPSEVEDIKTDSKKADEFRNKITEYVLARLKKTNVSVYDLANEMALNERQLYRLAKSLTGCTPAQLIKEVRLQKAYELLASGKIYKIDDVSRQVGFETSAYFAKQFFERFGKKVGDFF